MSNKIETFVAFNQGMKRPDRACHMEFCGFESSCWDWISEEGRTPKSYAQFLARQFNQKTGKAAHVVYWQGGRNMDGERGYQYWIKAL
jgi:hypothetical protein